MANAGNKVGEAFVDLRVNTGKLKPDLDGAKVSVEQFGDTAEREMGRTTKATGETNKSVGQLGQNLLGLVGKITGAAAALGVLFRAATEVNKALRDGSEIATDFTNALGGAQFVDAEARLKSLQGVAAELSGELQGLGNINFDNLFGLRGIVRRLTGQLEEELAEINQQIQTSAELVQVRRIRAREQEAKAFAEALEREVQKALESAIDKAISSRRTSFNSIGLAGSTDRLAARQRQRTEWGHMTAIRLSPTITRSEVFTDEFGNSRTTIQYRVPGVSHTNIPPNGGVFGLPLRNVDEHPDITGFGLIARDIQSDDYGNGIDARVTVSYSTPTGGLVDLQDGTFAWSMSRQEVA
jgi:hypothetical protein